MPEQKTLIFLYTGTPLHAGAGRQTDGAVDLPIQREQATGYPIVQPSTLRGALRALATAQRPADEVACVFGPPPDAPEAEKFPSAVVVQSAQVLIFPVRSVHGVFAWATSAAVLARFARSAADHSLTLPGLPWSAVGAGQAKVVPNSQVRGPQGRATLEDVTFAAQPDPALATLGRWLAEHAFPADPTLSYWREKVGRDLVLLPEDAYAFFVAHSTEVVARIRIDPRTGAAAPGALWTEESLPADTLLAVPLAATDPVRPTGTLNSAAAVLRWLQDLVPPVLQVGGSRTLGRGFVHVRWADGSGRGTR